MSSFTHYVESDILNQHIAVDGLYIGLSRQDGNRQGEFADWTGTDINNQEPTAGIDEPGTGYVEDDGSWVTEDSLGLASSYARQSIGAADWYSVEVVLGENGDSELRLSSNVTFATLTSGENWGTITHFFIVDSSTIDSGNIIAWGSMPDSVELVEGMEAKLWANTIVVRMTD